MPSNVIYQNEPFLLSAGNSAEVLLSERLKGKSRSGVGVSPADGGADRWWTTVKENNIDRWPHLIN